MYNNNAPHSERRLPGSRVSVRGMTLVELMVSITITLIVVAALIALFLNVSSAQREMNKVNQQIETGRISTFVLENEIALAGFWENYVPQFDDVTLPPTTALPLKVPTGLQPDPCLPYYAADGSVNWTPDYMRTLLDIPVQVYAQIPVNCTTVLQDQKAGTDVLVIRHADTAACPPGAPVAGCESGKLYFWSSQCGTGSNKQEPSAFDLSIPDPITGLSTSPTPMWSRNCAAPTPTPSLRRKFISDIYYIRTYAETPADAIPTLVRSRFDVSGAKPLETAQQPPVPLVEGVEGLRVEFGLAPLSTSGPAVGYPKLVAWSDPANMPTPTNRGDGSPDGVFVHCSEKLPPDTGDTNCSADQLANVVAVKLYVLARSTAPTSSYQDKRTYTLGGGTFTPAGAETGFRRHAFATSIRLNNVAGRRETP